MENFWQTCVQRLEQELPPQQISAWIRPLTPLSYDETEAVLRVGAPNRFKLDWARTNFSSRIETLAAEWFQRPVQVRFELDPAARSAVPARAPAAAPAPAATDVAAAWAPSTPPRPAAGATGRNAPPAPQSPLPSNNTDATVVYDRSRLNTELTFDNFVTGKA